MFTPFFCFNILFWWPMTYQIRFPIRLTITAETFDHNLLCYSCECYFTVTFWLAQYSTTPPYANANTCPIPVNPLGCIVHDKWCTAQPQGHTQTGIPFEYAPHMYWKTGVYENVTPQFEYCPSILFGSLITGNLTKENWDCIQEAKFPSSFSFTMVLSQIAVVKQKPHSSSFHCTFLVDRITPYDK